MNEEVKCKMVVSPAKVESKVKKLVRRVVQAVKPTMCSVRFDTNAGKWAVLDDQNRPVRHFDKGYMENAEFDIVRSERVYCGGLKYAAIATGALRENYSGGSVTGFYNLRFDGEHMVGIGAEPIVKARALRLLPNRRALYLPAV